MKSSKFAANGHIQIPCVVGIFPKESPESIEGNQHLVSWCRRFLVSWLVHNSPQRGMLGDSPPKECPRASARSAQVTQLKQEEVELPWLSPCSEGNYLIPNNCLSALPPSTYIKYCKVISISIFGLESQQLPSRALSLFRGDFFRAFRVFFFLVVGDSYRQPDETFVLAATESEGDFSEYLKVQGSL